jgi:hypothetical protein
MATNLFFLKEVPLALLTPAALWLRARLGVPPKRNFVPSPESRGPWRRGQREV